MNGKDRKCYLVMIDDFRNKRKEKFQINFGGKDRKSRIKLIKGIGYHIHQKSQPYQLNKATKKKATISKFSFFFEF
jgi:hypothetical protein